MNLLQPMAVQEATVAMEVGGVIPMVAQEAVVVMGEILEVEAAVVMVVEVIMGQVMVTEVAKPNIVR
ncbi:hypothetical protein BFI45_22090 [Yersinia pestis subsp. microtus bv. Altaica]|uniref:Uncharacterized protein n=4 Tax=Yersinia pseudotuberculosis complex TaxID=1649845 RepID=A0A5K1V5K8_YERPE|nr:MULTISPECIES: hypothetical protein [Yersinia pseudotuberculosis complex]AAS61223.1 hypothetical protein YP_0971 [Yersinia pestis biovar Microtus str. 91001]AJJ70023.1 hypothetical protein BZ23_809 [Yersinia pseudotuberculosis]AJK12250.1 hypothetical protein CH60_2580 [Yersinia pestis str. Pestoides B]AXY32385.1 hypothetical protein CEQ20_02520 [Yersinia pseudotuberculosis]AYW83121.1 hypothetical protein EGX42_09155 [Yersinia pestis]